MRISAWYGRIKTLMASLSKWTESWTSAGYLKTEENLNNRGFISRTQITIEICDVVSGDYVPTTVENVFEPGLNIRLQEARAMQIHDYCSSTAGDVQILNQFSSFLRTVVMRANFKDVWVSLYRCSKIYNILITYSTNIWVRDIATNRQIAIPNSF
jgi:hypothetical protein